jgi:hypothetical protein
MSVLDQIQALGFLARWRLTSHALYYKIPYYKPDCPTAALGLAKEFCMALITSSLLLVFCNVSLIDMDIINS